MQISAGGGRTRPAAGLRMAGLCTAALLMSWTPAADTVTAGGRAGKLPASPCDLPFSQGEWATFTTVALRLSRAPAAGQTATMAIGVCARRTGAVRALIVLPGGFGWARPPPGMTISRRTSRDPASFGCLTRASATWHLTAMHPLRLSATVIARKTGFAALTASATYVSPVIVPAGSDSVYITVGPTAASSHFGYRAGNAQSSSNDVSSSTPVPSRPPPAPTCR
jgi:hypothetical protein